MRRVSTWLNHLADNELKRRDNRKIYFIGQERDRVIIDKEDGSWNRYKYISLEKFLSLHLHTPARRIYFNFYDQLFTDKRWLAHFPAFFEHHASNITDLALSELVVPLTTETEIIFFRNVMISLQIFSTGILRFNDSLFQQNSGFLALQNITKLSIDNLDLNKGYEVTELTYFWSLVQSCTNLRHFTFPYYLVYNALRMENQQEYFELGYKKLATILGEGQLTQLQTCDLKNLEQGDEDLAGPGTFFQYCQKLMNRGVKILNVHFKCFDNYNNQQQLHTFGDVTLSVRHYRLDGGHKELPNMEEIYIITSETEAGIRNERGRFRAPLWPALRKLNLIINSFRLDGIGTDELFRALFEIIQRPSVQNLELCGEIFGNYCHYIYPKLEDVAWCCYKLTSITIKDWVALDADFASLWRGLPQLECITLNNCYTIGLLAFTGGDNANPLFLILERLRKLRFLKVHNMVNLNDRLFKSVISRLPLEEFILDSHISQFNNQIEDVISLSVNGIANLLNPPFADTIRTFPFNCWKLDSYSMEEMRDLGGFFRSTYLK